MSTPCTAVVPTADKNEPMCASESAFVPGSRPHTAATCDCTKPVQNPLIPMHVYSSSDPMLPVMTTAPGMASVNTVLDTRQPSNVARGDSHSLLAA